MNQMMGINKVLTFQQAQQALFAIDTNHDGLASKQEIFYAFRNNILDQGYFFGGQQYVSSGYNYQQIQQMNYNQPLQHYHQAYIPQPNNPHFQPPPPVQVHYHPPPPQQQQVIIIKKKN